MVATKVEHLPHTSKEEYRRKWIEGGFDEKRVTEGKRSEIHVHTAEEGSRIVYTMETIIQATQVQSIFLEKTASRERPRIVRVVLA
jgi:hypothetical protein